jgi:signal transduction histidine kinase
LEERNQDQVVSRSKEKWTKKAKRPPDEEAPILMVPQLWVWRVGNHIISASSMTRASDGNYFKNYEISLSMHLCEYFYPKLSQPYPELQLALIIAGFIDGFGHGYSDNDISHPSTLDLFETRVVNLLSEVRGYTAMRERNLNFRQEQYFLHVISDVRSELAMIKSVLEQQEDILKEMLKDLPESVDRFDPSDPRHAAGPPDWTTAEDALVTLERYKKRVDKIDGDADRIEKAIQDMLNLKRTFASIKDAHNSLILSTAVIGFTIVTIIFAPLAFLTALFALNVEGFGKLHIKGLDGVYDSGKLGGIFRELAKEVDSSIVANTKQSAAKF